MIINQDLTLNRIQICAVQPTLEYSVILIPYGNTNFVKFKGSPLSKVHVQL